MRLLQLEDDGEFSLIEFVGDSIPQYAILSHTWGPDSEEVTFKDLVNGTGKEKDGYHKIRFCGKQAANNGLRFSWVDTCCIDKSSSAELSEAINSMFRWYQDATKCYVYLSDVSVSSSFNDESLSQRWKPAFRKSRWFTRGWTLQELIAPKSVEFFSKEGQRLGDRQSMEQTLHEITGIAIQALQGNPMLHFSVNERLSWAERRQTTREEDAVYCLLGIFNIHMPLIYGEGRQKAFNRLQKEIMDETSINLPVANGASFDSHMEEHNSRCLPNTRKELLHSIREWVKDRNGKPIFWLNGMAGTGKSTIARTVAQFFADQHQLGASFFFKRGEGERGNATRLFTTIATDLTSHVPGMRLGIRKAIDADPAISEKALKDQFEKLILQSLLGAAPLQASTLVIVIDALDECERDEDIRAILQLLSRTKNLRTKNLKPVSLRIFVTSRPELHIRLGFRKMPDGTYEDLVLHKVAKPTIEHDIRLFFEHELGEIRQQRSLSPAWPSKDQINALVELAVPLFIFAATACRYIGEQRDNPIKRLDIVLKYQKKMVSKLDATYLPILNQLFDEADEEDKERWASEFRKIVGAIVVLESPLSITSLSHLLSISREDISCRLDSLHSVLSIPDSEDVPVRLLHLSFREFLVDPQKRGRSPFWVDEKETHKRLATQCLRLMSSLKGLRQNICNLLEPGTLRSKIDKQTIANGLPTELQYACRYWVHHLEQSKQRIRDGESIYTFLQKHFLHWLEAMSLIGETYTSIHMINGLQVLTESVKSASSSFLRDAKRFALRFRHILEDAPLQIYSSALNFAPVTSIMRQTFAAHRPEWVSILSGVEDDWDACRSTLEGHSNSVRAVAFSPDGQLVASASNDNTVRLWEAATGSCRSTLEGHSGWVSAVTFSPDGQLVASASGDNTVRLWEATTGSCRSTLKGHSDWVNAVTFSPDGQLVASASDDRTVRLWEAATSSCRGMLEGHLGWVRAVAFSPDGQLIASASGDNTVRLWEAATGLCRGTLEGHLESVSAVAFSPDGQLVASASGDNTVRLWKADAATGSCCSTLKGHSYWVGAVAFSPDGQLVASASGDNTVRLWETATGSCRGMLKGHSDSVSAVTFSPDGQLVASASDDRTVRLWEVATSSCRGTLEGHSDSVRTVTFSPDGQLVASTSDDRTVRLWEAETATGSCRSMLEGHSYWVSAVAFSPDGQLVASASEDRTVRLWEAATGSCHGTLEDHLGWVNAFTFSPDGQLVASASDYGTIRLWEVATGSCRNTLEGHLNWVRAVSFSQDGHLVASASEDRTVRLWEVATGSCRSTLEGHSDSVSAVAFSPDGQLVASASDDRTVRLWEAATGSCRSMLKGHSDSVRTVTFSPDGQLVASASDDRTVRLWEAATGSCRRTLEGHSGSVSAVAFSPDGQYVETDRGRVPLNLSPSNASSSHQNKQPTFYVTDQWVTYNESRLLWLPPEYRPVCMVAWRNMICMGHASGRLTLLQLCENEIKV